MNGELAAMADLARRLVECGTPGTLATLFSARGSTYRPLGSMMVSLAGMHAGGISGGCLEDYVARAGERATRTAPAVMLQFDTHPDRQDDVPALGCGGSIQVLIERLTAGHAAFLERFACAAGGDDAAWIACHVRRDGASIAVTREWLSHRSTRNSSHETIAPGAEVLVQYVPPITRLVIFGAGDDAMPLCEIGASLGWHVTVADCRTRLATQERFPNSDAVLAGDWDDVVDATTFSMRTAAVLMTHSVDDDARVVSRLAGKPLSYLGALGPAHRRDWLVEQASVFGVDRENDDGPTLRGPIGLDLGDRSPAGIAVAVAAEILAHLNRRDARPLHVTGTTTTATAPARCHVAS